MREDKGAEERRRRNHHFVRVRADNGSHPGLAVINVSLSSGSYWEVRPRLHLRLAHVSCYAVDDKFET